jgi:hypothetical protein
MGEYVVGPGKRPVWGKIVCKYMRCETSDLLEYTFRETCAYKTVKTEEETTVKKETQKETAEPEK